MAGWPVTITVNGVALDPCRVALPVSITHGRSAVGSQPDAPSLEFTWLGSEGPGAIGDSVTLGEQVLWSAATYDSATVDYDDSAAVYDDDGTGIQVKTRFVGHIASLVANEIDGMPASWDVECIGVQARLGFIPVKASRPKETDIARVQGICATAGVTIRILGSNTVTLAAKSLDGDALEALHDVCNSSAGLLWQSPDGTLNYGASDHRSLTVAPVGALPCEAIASGLAWAEAVESIVNEVTTKSSTGGSTTQKDTASIAKPWGLRHLDVDTDCADLADLQALALVIIARRAWPYWGTPQALVHGHKLDAEGLRLISMLDVSTMVLAPFEALPGSVPSDLTPATVEGWAETWDDRHSIQVALSDPARWVVTRERTYTEVEALGTYNDLLAQGTYINLLVVKGA